MGLLCNIVNLRHFLVLLVRTTTRTIYYTSMSFVTTIQPPTMDPRAKTRYKKNV